MTLMLLIDRKNIFFNFVLHFNSLFSAEYKTERLIKLGISELMFETTIYCYYIYYYYIPLLHYKSIWLNVAHVRLKKLKEHLTVFTMMN